MKKRYTAKHALVIATGLAVLYSFYYFYLSSASANNLPPLKNGDLIFQTSTSNQSMAVAITSGSLYTHMGIIGEDSNRFVVYEASSTVKKSNLEEWIKKGVGGKITIKRYNDLSNEDAKRIITSASKFIGLPYDPYFYLEDGAIYCSELAYYAYKQGAGLQLGTLQKIKDLSIENIATKNLIAKRWKNHPICKKEKSTEAKCLESIKNTDIITPISIANDNTLTTIYTNY